MAAKAAESGLRGLARIALGEKKRAGAVSRDVRFFSDLPYQYSRVGSFEIAFARPPRGLVPDDEVFVEMGRLLEQGLKSLRAADAPAIEGLDADQTAQLFEAIKALAPPAGGRVTKIEIGGGLVDGLKFSKVLTPDDHRWSIERVRAARRAPAAGPPFLVTGVLEEGNRGTGGFTPRNLIPPVPAEMAGKSEIRFKFADRLLDDVVDAWNTQEPVAVVGRQVGGDFHALDIQQAPRPDRE